MADFGCGSDSIELVRLSIEAARVERDPPVNLKIVKAEKIRTLPADEC